MKMGTTASVLNEVKSVPVWKSIDDNGLMRLVSSGEGEAFFIIVARYKNPMVNYLYRLLGDYETAVELAQEVFIRIFRSVQRYDPGQKFSTWIYKIATNLAIDEMRRRKRQHDRAIPLDFFHDNLTIPSSAMSAAIGPAKGPDPEEQVLLSEMQQKLMEAVHALPDEQKHIFILKEIVQKSLEEISAITGVKVGTLKSRLFRARLFLRDRLSEYLRTGLTP